MSTAYIVEAVRTAGGRRGGRLAGVHPVDLLAASLDAIVDRSGIDPNAVDDVITGCVTQAGEQAMQVARMGVLASNLPDSTPAVTIDRQCGSSQQAIQFAAQAVMSGTQDVVIASGVESMSRVPMGSNATLHMKEGLGHYKSPRLEEKFPGIQFSQFMGAEMIAKKHGFSKDDLDRFALSSHEKAIAATQAGAFENEIVPIEIETPEGTEMHTVDEGIRFDATLEGIAGVKLLSPEGKITAASSSQICDGSSAVLVVSEEALKKYGLTPIARIHNLTVTAGDPVIMLEEPLFATDKALERAGLKIDDIDLYEVNEAFAPVPLAWLKHTGADPDKLNVHGGAIALGHPLGASGTKLMATLVHALKRHGKKYGLQTMCEGGGVANVTIVEAV
ncbi:acetyl-CoA C-acetyltransferase [Erythrobacter litoralis]|jgi:acetyl-CoA C-acetyltransferase|uniref:Acetyl-CoA acetyltransferase n=1 Tax=Erythrobacter litoralis TaxID=39960 RepID=A0A074MND1_9SPHN|nr:acetyl-CoA C-acetyltransferase [Erythrobacter litoralis]AOL24402.1 acetyl-CoA C-acetyltransferase [Erythrobacter litoralis]KEO93358.1 acetyl-CoA acetyltransferase [Erythrobacter litoralis]MEE4338629.1 acetyl-CoA C-acetyltransferase [Erythrobacter sp.]